MDETTVDMGEVLAGLTKTGRLSKGDKHWITVKLQDEHRHQRNMQFLKTLESNPDLPFVLMFLGGAVGAAMIELVKKIESTTDEEKKKTWQQELAGLGENLLDYESLITGGIVGYMVQEQVIGNSLKNLHEGNPPKTWVDFAANTASSLSVSISAFGASILVLRAIFGNSSKDGGMASLAGLIA